MTRAKTIYPPETRASVVAEILSGHPINEVAKRWNIPQQTAQGWWAIDRPTESTNARTRERMVEHLYDTAFDSLEGVRASARLLQDTSWTRTQSAADIAALVAVLSDRTIRMLGGLRPAGYEQQPALGDGAESAD